MSKLKRIIKVLATKILEAFYLYFYYKSPIDNSIILCESSKGKDLGSNIFYLLKVLNKDYSNYKIYLSYSSTNKNDIESLLNTYSLNHIKLVNIRSLTYLRLLAKAKYLINDTSFPTMYIKKDNQIYLNTWHGTPFKKMGQDEVNKANMGNVQRNLLMSDYLLFPNKEIESKMSQAYSLDNLYKGKIINSGYPRNSIFFNTRLRNETRSNLDISNKKVIGYMPTWRNNQDLSSIKEHLDYIDNHLTYDDVFYVKLHNLDKQSINLESYKHIKAFPSNIETYEFLNCIDILITDYSSVMFDYMLTSKKVILFAYDYQDYQKQRGLYYKIEDLPFDVAYNVEDLVKEIKSNHKSDYSAYKESFSTYEDKNSSNEILEIVIDNKDTSKVKRLIPNNKKNTIFFVSSLDLNGVTSSILSLLNTIDLSKENYYFTYFESRLKNNYERINQLPKEGHVFPITKSFNYTFKEAIASFFYYYLNKDYKWVNSLLSRHYQREGKRIYGNVVFDHAIQYTGYHPAIIRLFQEMPSKRAIWVHNDMNNEIKVRKIKSYPIYKSAYSNYDKVVGVSQIAIDSAISISHRSDNTQIIENPFDSKRIINLSKESFTYDEDTQSNFSLSQVDTILKSNATKFINIGRFSVEKGQKRLIDAFNEYYQTNKETYLFIVGGHGPLYQELIDSTQSLDCKDNVVFIKSLKNPFSLLKQCDLFILSSLYEGLGLVLLEANVLNVPSLSTDIPGPREFMNEHKGYLVPDSQEGLYQGMLDYKKGRVKTFNFNVEEYNEVIKKQFDHLFD